MGGWERRDGGDLWGGSLHCNVQAGPAHASLSNCCCWAWFLQVLWQEWPHMEKCVYRKGNAGSAICNLVKMSCWLPPTPPPPLHTPYSLKEFLPKEYIKQRGSEKKIFQVCKVFNRPKVSRSCYCYVQLRVGCHLANIFYIAYPILYIDRSSHHNIVWFLVIQLRNSLITW